MKPLLLACLLIIAVNGFAQKRYMTIYRDTINIKGIIYEADGKPATKVWVSSKNRTLRSPHNIVSSTTDSLGRFELIGAKTNDTIAVTSINTLWVANNGSRYMEITLPAIKINVLPTAAITAVRLSARKVLPAIKVEMPEDDSFYGEGGYESDADFPGGINNFIRYVQARLRYPQQAVKNNITGEVQVSFIIKKDGTPANFKIVRGLGYGCDEALLNLLKDKKWKPASKNGRAYEPPQSLTVQFKLTDK